MRWENFGNSIVQSRQLLILNVLTTPIYKESLLHARSQTYKRQYLSVTPRDETYSVARKGDEIKCFLKKANRKNQVSQETEREGVHRRLSRSQKAKKEIAVSQLVAGVSQTAFITGKQLDALSALDNQKRDVHIAIFPAANYLANVQVSDAEVEQEYKANPAKYTAEEKVAVDYMVLGAELFTSKVLLTDADVEAQYAEKVKSLEANEQRRAAHILIKTTDKVKDADALAKIQEIEKKVKAGEDFGALAKQFSQDEGSAISNGDLGFVSKGAFVPEFEKAMYGLKQSNSISEKELKSRLESYQSLVEISCYKCFRGQSEDLNDIGMIRVTTADGQDQHVCNVCLFNN